FVASAVIAGTGGWLYAHYIRIMDPNIFGMGILFDVIFMAILGGIGTLVGPIVGALVVRLGPELVSEVYTVNQEWRTAFLAIFMLAIIILLPLGVWGTIKMRWRQFQAKRAGGPPSEPMPPTPNKLVESIRGMFTRRSEPEK
ncbi:MAG: branched-chain amino acid ABC transporter permease, partial [Dehalococcoidia bacterium]|nr:branched-chain amino acid ABC transporter permease [Dehalococcoidia bacterium]